jgi:hypothetical protein
MVQAMLNSFFFSAKAGDIGEVASRHAAVTAVTAVKRYLEVRISSPSSV